MNRSINVIFQHIKCSPLSSILWLVTVHSLVGKYCSSLRWRENCNVWKVKMFFFCFFFYKMHDCIQFISPIFHFYKIPETCSDLGRQLECQDFKFGFSGGCSKKFQSKSHSAKLSVNGLIRGLLKKLSLSQTFEINPLGLCNIPSCQQGDWCTLGFHSASCSSFPEMFLKKPAN